MRMNQYRTDDCDIRWTGAISDVRLTVRVALGVFEFESFRWYTYCLLADALATVLLLRLSHVSRLSPADYYI